jgi:RNA polymerase sigma-70 factor (ECF subfamily)
MWRLVVSTSESTLTDEELVRRCRAEVPYGTVAFEILVRRYEPSVLRTCWHYLRDSAEAQEASQDVFVRVFRGLQRFEGRSSLRTWLFRIVRNVCVTRRMSRNERGTRELVYVQEATRQADVAREEAARDDPPHRRDGNALAASPGRAGAAVATLSRLDREILVLRFVSDLQLEGIAEMLDLSLSAAKMRLYRGLERFRCAYERSESDV